jgi:hypothetical protein
MAGTQSTASKIFSSLPIEIPLVLAALVSIQALMPKADPAAKKQAVMDLVNDAIQGVETVAGSEYATQVAALQPGIDKVVDGLTDIFVARKLFGFAPASTLVTPGATQGTVVSK